MARFNGCTVRVHPRRTARKARGRVVIIYNDVISFVRYYGSIAILINVFRMKFIFKGEKKKYRRLYGKYNILYDEYIRIMTRSGGVRKGGMSLRGENEPGNCGAGRGNARENGKGGFRLENNNNGTPGRPWRSEIRRWNFNTNVSSPHRRRHTTTTIPFRSLKSPFLRAQCR